MLGDVDWNLDVIHLQDYGLPHLPDSPTCPNLVKLFLQVPSLVVVPPAFFEHMQGLKVLDLSNTNIVSLPASISSLRLLQELFLRDCSALLELPSEIGMLSKLKLFDIKGTELMFLPKEMGKLKDLEVLRVTLSQYAKDYIKTSVNETVIPRKMISELKKLNELCVIISIGPEPEWWEEEVKYLQNELCDLENLETLVWYLPTNELLQQFLLLERNHVPIYANLSNLKLTIGQHARLTSCLPHGLEKKFHEFKNCLKWINAEGNVDDIAKIMASAEALFLSRHWTVEKLSTFNVTKLKYCLLAECNEMKTLVEAPEDVENRIKYGEKVGFELLQYLSIHCMNKLQNIWKGPIGKDSLSKLRILALHTCPHLTSIFSPTIAQNLSSLTEITVEDCPRVTSLISNESHNIKHGPIFPSLENIFLLDLPVLANIFAGRIMLVNLRNLLIYSCLQLRDLSNMELPRIETIKGEDEWWKALDCDTSSWQKIFVQLKEKRDLVEQLFQATNSLQHFHDYLLHEKMPISPVIRCSPGRESRGGSHKRRWSLESGIMLKERDDDLALFNEVQSKEKDGFLLQDNVDLEDIFATKLSHYSGHKFGRGISAGARRNAFEFLNAEDEKNDYEWLLDPPDSPLFPLLDDETRRVIPHRGIDVELNPFQSPDHQQCSPGRESRGGTHKRGWSLESGIVLKERDDDLALFNEVQSKEKDGFLLQDNVDLEDIFATKLSHYSGHKFGRGISAGARRKAIEFLNAEEEKNDYEWLLDPPDSPLLPLLDDLELNPFQSPDHQQ